MTLVLRLVKGSQLTHTELDGNFTYLDNRISGMTSSVDVAPYNGGTTYTGSTYVSYAGNLYLHISGTPTTGVIPDSNPTKWQLVSSGVLIHEKNKDTYLDFGGANQVSASEIRSLIDNSTLILTTQSDLSDAVINGTLIREAVYLVTDSDPVFYVKAQTANSLYHDAFAVRYIPKHVSLGGTYDFWNIGSAYAINNKVVYGNYVYKNLTGDNSGNPRVTGLDWEIVSPLSVPADYIFSTVKSKIQQRKDYGVNGLIEFEDSDGNEFMLWQYPSIGTTNNKFINSFWFGHDMHVEGTFRNNIFKNIQSVGASFERIMGVYEFNEMFHSVFNSNYGVFDGEFKQNNIRNGVLSSATESTNAGFKFNYNVLDFPSTVGISITLRPDAVIENCVINSKGSDAVDVLDGSSAVTGSTLDLNANGANDAYGIFEIDVADIDINNIVGYPSTNFKSVLIKPKPGITMFYTSVNIVTADGQLVDDGLGLFSLPISGDQGDYIQITPRVANGFNVFYVEHYNVT